MSDETFWVSPVTTGWLYSFDEDGRCLRVRRTFSFGAENDEEAALALIASIPVPRPPPLSVGTRERPNE